MLCLQLNRPHLIECDMLHGRASKAHEAVLQAHTAEPHHAQTHPPGSLYQQIELPLPWCQSFLLTPCTILQHRVYCCATVLGQFADNVPPLLPGGGGSNPPPNSPSPAPGQSPAPDQNFPPFNPKSILASGSRLAAGRCIMSPNARYRMCVSAAVSAAWSVTARLDQYYKFCM